MKVKSSPSMLPSGAIEDIAQQLIAQLCQEFRGPTKNARFSARYTGAQNHEDRQVDEQSKLIFWGHSASAHKKVATKKRIVQLRQGEKIPLSTFSTIIQWKIWLAVWSCTDIYDIRSVALQQLDAPHLRTLHDSRAKDLFRIAKDIDNWALSDSLSGMLSALLELRTTHLSVYRKWNHSQNPWLRRQSIVGLYYYARQRKKHVHVGIALDLVESLLEDKHFYVQRGVGWTLREIDRVDSQQQKKFVQKNLHRISAVAWFAATELYPLELRKKLVQKRSGFRSKK